MPLRPLDAVFLALSLSLSVFADSDLVEPLSKDNSPQCQCYLTDGPDPGYFQYHRFWDFRNIPNDGDNDYTVAPDLVSDAEDQGTEPITASYFNTSSWLTDWAIQTGVERPNAIVPTFNSAQNVYISRNSTDNPTSATFLTLRQNRLESFMSISEIDSNQKNLLHASIRVRARIIPNGISNSSAPSAGSRPVDNDATGSNASHPVDAGAVFGFFTYHNDEQESDIEVLTYDPTTQIHYSNQPDYDAKTDSTVPGATNQVSLPDGAVWTEWQDHRIDWFDGMSRWYVNDILVQNKTVNVPKDHSGLTINLWGDGGSWSGNMSVGGQVTVGIEWIDMVFNISGNVNGDGSHKKRDGSNGLWKRKQSYCEIGCNVDGIQAVGFPEVLYNVSSTAFSILRQGDGGATAVFTYGAAVLTLLFVLFI